MSKFTPRELREALSCLEAENRFLRDRAEASHDARDPLDIAFDAVPHLVFLIGADDAILAYRAGKDSADKLYRPPAEFIGRTFGEVLPRDAGRILTDGIHQARATAQHVVVRYALPLGEHTREFEARIVPLAEGRVATLAIDITEQLRAEDEIRTSRARFEAVADAMPIPVLITRVSDGRILYANTPLGEMFEMPREAMLGRETREFYQDPRERESVRQRIERDGSIRDFELLVHSATGRSFWVSFSAQLTSWNGEHAILAGLLDLSGRKRIEGTLRASEELYRALFEANPFPMWAYDIETLGFVAVNDAAVRHYGFSREEFARMSIREIRPPEELPRFNTFLEGSRHRAGPVHYLGRHWKKDKSVIDVEVTAATIVFQGRPARMATIHDITERTRLEEELRRVQKLESIGRLAGGIAHDFNNLLTAILGYTQLLEARLAGEPELLADLGEIRQAGIRARDLTAQLLAVARRQVSTPKVLDLSALARTVERLLRRLLGEPVELVTRFADTVWPIKADAAQLEQILMNLAVNARDAMPRGGTLTITTENVTVGEAGDPRPPGLAPGPYVLLEVSDTGIGMSEETLAHVFEPFFTTKPPGEGTGLGLATLYGIVKQSGGQVWVQSEPKRGTTFRIYFPRSGEPLLAPVAESASVPRGGDETVLVVEDDAGVRALAVRALEQAGYTVEVAIHGEEALAVAARMPRPIHLLLTDVVMPKMSGPEVAQRLLESRPQLRVLYVSGYAPDTVIPQTLVEDRTKFLSKPFTATMLLEKVRDVLDAPGPRGQA